VRADVLLNIGAILAMQGTAVCFSREEEELAYRTYFGLGADVAIRREHDVPVLREARDTLSAAMAAATHGSLRARCAQELCSVLLALKLGEEATRVIAEGVLNADSDILADVRLRLALTLLELGDIEGADRELRQVVRDDLATYEGGGHLSVIAHGQLGVLALARGDVTAACTQLRAGIFIAPCCHLNQRRGLAALARRLIEFGAGASVGVIVTALRESYSLDQIDRRAPGLVDTLSDVL